jgi:hypothetical protein
MNQGDGIGHASGLMGEEINDARNFRYRFRPMGCLLFQYSAHVGYPKADAATATGAVISIPG